MPSIIDLLLGRTGQDVTGTGINPNAQGPDELLRQALSGVNPNTTTSRPSVFNTDAQNKGLPQPQESSGLLSKIGGAANKVGDFIGTPGGSFLLNLLNQQGYSATPTGGPLAALGRAGLQTQQQGAARDAAALQKQLIESQIGLNTAKAGEAERGTVEMPKATTDLGKLESDVANGIITRADADARRSEILSALPQRTFENENKLRAEFDKTTKGITTSLTSVSQAESLLATSENPIAELAAFVSLIQSIDNSTVREGELRNYGSVNGILEDLKTQVTRAKGEGAFSPEVRSNIQEALIALRNNLLNIHNGYKDYYGGIADDAGLNSGHVIGAQAPRAATALDVAPVVPTNTNPPPPPTDPLKQVPIV